MQISTSCNNDTDIQDYNYGTQSDSALYYFNKGWVSILDYGQWEKAEESFRKAAYFDSGFIIGKSLVGRISSDLEERKQILIEIRNGRSSLGEDQKLLLDVYSSNIHLMNLRDEGIVTPEFRKEHRKKALVNFKTFIRKHPEASYVKAEYIETIHAVYGAQTALDSLQRLSTELQKNIPFYIYYTAILNAELDNFEAALSGVRSFESSVQGMLVPQTSMLFASFFFEMDSLDKALHFVNDAIELDPKHLMAHGLKLSILLRKEKK